MEGEQIVLRTGGGGRKTGSPIAQAYFHRASRPPQLDLTAKWQLNSINIFNSLAIELLVFSVMVAEIVNRI